MGSKCQQMVLEVQKKKAWRRARGKKLECGGQNEGSHLSSSLRFTNTLLHVYVFLSPRLLHLPYLPVSPADLNNPSTASSVAPIDGERDENVRVKDRKKTVNERL